MGKNGNFMVIQGVFKKMIKKTLENRGPNPIRFYQDFSYQAKTDLTFFITAKPQKPINRYAFIPKSDILSPGSKQEKSS